LQELFQRRELFEISLSAFERDAAVRLGPFVIGSLFDLHYSFCFKHTQVPAQVAFGK
jgi:hypothetical protein